VLESLRGSQGTALILSFSNAHPTRRATDLGVLNVIQMDQEFWLGNGTDQGTGIICNFLVQLTTICHCDFQGEILHPEVSRESQSLCGES